MIKIYTRNKNFKSGIWSISDLASYLYYNMQIQISLKFMKYE